MYQYLSRHVLLRVRMGRNRIVFNQTIILLSCYCTLVHVPHLWLFASFAYSFSRMRGVGVTHTSTYIRILARHICLRSCVLLHRSVLSVCVALGCYRVCVHFDVAYTRTSHGPCNRATKSA